ncbi:MAG: MBOAT family protein [Nitrospirae bacterium]|nr:MBOAT family protein [Nitrospirota bacterium]
MTAIFLNRHQLILFITLASYLFYSLGSLPHLFLLLISTVVNFYAGIAIAASLSRNRKKLYLTLSLLFNLGLLATFKYADFLAANFNNMFSLLGMTYTLPQPHILLPIGISYFTFVSLGYSIDIYRGEFKPVTNIIDFSCFISFFPKLVAGPIVRAKEFLPQLKDFRPFNRQNMDTGFGLILIGFFKKAVIADNISPFVDKVYGDPSQFGSAACWLATISFAVQLYCDFSGYIDIARGLSKIIGLELPHNFRWPYLSESVRDFWRRWHMTLSFWIRDYLYIPLGGSRCSRPRMLINLFITWFAMGLWHGASWTYVAWGLYHGIIVSFEHMMSNLKFTSRLAFIPALPKILLTFLLVTFGWVLFRASDLTSAALIFKKMIFIGSGDLLQGVSEFQKLNAALLSVSIVMHYFAYRVRDSNIPGLIFTKTHWVVRVASYALMAAFIVIFSGKAANFIYFQF